MTGDQTCLSMRRRTRQQTEEYVPVAAIGRVPDNWTRDSCDKVQRVTDSEVKWIAG